MQLKSKTADEITLGLSQDELRSIANAVNEVCNGVHIADSEFAMRLGVDRAELAAMLGELSDYTNAPNDEWYVQPIDYANVPQIELSLASLLCRPVVAYLCLIRQFRPVGNS